MIPGRVPTTPLRTEQDKVVAIEELRRQLQDLKDEVTKLIAQVNALTPS